ncbi:hypothetical protein M409DRAFT_29548 [Zasmidium cellare ATCC 36951]|uniref:Uncharacterized protein n=1 Tax=Zasmidium cellare ATCC 36951 TaxID=1080233 RepID=A0A6A6C0Z5_ZASCE|nr:uncharacterized protein M409DRAFT_29548 [Zasmidium cellare ATCC 36951]KAF2159938.1 hypothetical protein M409DRAFT_29548 [Zasmidium cellare ATCC 36951]
MAPTSRKQTHCAAVDRPLGRVGVNSSDTQDTQLHPDSECSATEEPTTTIVHALAKFQAILNCKLDDFDTYNDFYLAFNKAVNEFEALPGSEKLHEQIKFLMFASNLGPWFRPWINFLSESRNLVGIGSKKGERVGFHQFDREIRNYGLNAARHKFWEKRIQWRSHGRLEIIDSTGWIPKWLPTDANAELRVYPSRAPFTPYIIRKGLFLDASEKFKDLIEGDRLSLAYQPRVVHVFVVWLRYETLLDPGRTLDAGTYLDVHLPPDFIYDALTDRDLADLFIFASFHDIRTLRNDVMTQLILQHYVYDDIVSCDIITRVQNALLQRKNHFVDFAITDLARLSWDDPDMLPDELGTLDRKLLADLVGHSAFFARAATTDGVAFSSAEKVCFFHDHLEGGLRKCRRKQRRLGLPCMFEDE